MYLPCVFVPSWLIAPKAPTKCPAILGYFMPASIDSSAAADASKSRSDDGETDQPAGVRSPTVLALHSSGWLLLLCLFLPVCRSCNGAVVRPVDSLEISSPVQAWDIAGCAVLLAVYGNGVLIAFLLTISAGLRSREFWWRTFRIQFAVTLTVAVTILGLIALDASSLKDWMGETLSLLPLLGGGLAWIAAALRYDNRQLAWARLQHVWTIGAVFNLHLHCVFSTRLLYGYGVTLVALAGQLFAVELARLRMHHDLWDRSQPPHRPQFTVGGLLFWMTLLPLVFAYYQAVDPVVEWLFPEK